MSNEPTAAESMKLLSVNCGLPREVEWHGQKVSTGIFKSPVKGRVLLRRLNLECDRQADLTVHGGADKAVYCYQISHYEFWKKRLPEVELPMGAFGENFTIDGPAEDFIFVGDRFSVGSAEIVVTQPRQPCYKLGIRFGSDLMVRRFLASGRTGFYVKVSREGEVGAGDDLRLVSREADAVAVSEVTRLYLAESFTEHDLGVLRRLVKLEALPEGWKEYFQPLAEERPR